MAWRTASLEEISKVCRRWVLWSVVDQMLVADAHLRTDSPDAAGREFLAKDFAGQINPIDAPPGTRGASMPKDGP
jgi:hypothetical protein